MTTQERVMEAAKLRLRFQMNGRLRLESLAALSKVFREYGEPLREELLGSIVFAVPEELLGPADPSVHAQFSETKRFSDAPATPGGHPPARPDAPATPGHPPARPDAPATPGHPPARPDNAPATPGGNPPARPKGGR